MVADSFLLSAVVFAETRPSVYIPLHKRSCKEQREFEQSALGIASDDTLNTIRFNFSEGHSITVIKNSRKDKTGNCEPEPWEYADRATEVILQRFVAGVNTRKLLVAQGLDEKYIVPYLNITNEERKSNIDRPANLYFLIQKPSINPFEKTKTWDEKDANDEKIFLSRGEALRSRIKRASEAGEIEISLKFLQNTIPNSCARAYHEAMTRSGEGKPNELADPVAFSVIQNLSKEEFTTKARACAVNLQTSQDTKLGWMLGTRRGNEVFSNITK